MVGNMVLSNSAKMLELGVFLMFVYTTTGNKRP